MSKVYCDITVSVDWYVAGSNQVEQVAAAGAFVMGRNMFGPIRAEWDLDWKGWWGEDPHHAPVFVLTHHPRQPLAMQGGTTFALSPTALRAQ